MISRFSSAIRPDAGVPNDDALFAEIRQYDLKQELPITEPMRIRSEARLEQILATSPALPPMRRAGGRHQVSGFFRPRSLAAFGFRLAAVAVTAAIIVGISTLLPAGTGVQPAFASWTPAPTAVASDTAELADAICLQRLNRSLQSLNASQVGNALAELTGPPALAEQRGDWVLLSYTEGRQHAGCLIQMTSSGMVARSSWASSETGSSFMSTTSMGDEFEFGSPGTGDEFEFGGAGSVGAGAISVVLEPDSTGIRSFNVSQVAVPDAGTIRVFSGQVSPDVIAVTIAAGGDEQIEATVSNGTAIAWWPSELDPNIQISGFSLTYADGTVAEDAINVTQFGVTNQ